MNDNEKVRFLIVSTGRSGSSLIASILAFAGADFGMPMSKYWDRKSGAYEHPDLKKAERWYVRYKNVNDKIILNRLFYRLFLNIANTKLFRFLEDHQYMKTSNLIKLVHTTYKLGFSPKIIVPYRNFQDYALSRHRKSGWSYSQIHQEYVDTYRNVFLQLHAFGGCVISYYDLLDLEQTEWAHTLSTLTGLSQNKLLESRNELIKPINLSNNFQLFDHQTTGIFEKLDEYKGLVF